MKNEHWTIEEMEAAFDNCLRAQQAIIDSLENFNKALEGILETEEWKLYEASLANR